MSAKKKITKKNSKTAVKKAKKNVKKKVKPIKNIPKCQNRKGKNCIQFKGKNVYYTTLNNLAKQLEIRVLDAKTLVNESSTRIIMDANGNIDQIDIKNPDRELLTRHFGVRRVTNKDLIQGFERKTVAVMKKAGPNIPIREQEIHIELYISFPSESPEIEELLNDEGKYLYQMFSAREYEKLDNDVIFRSDFIKYYLNREAVNEFLDSSKISIRDKFIRVSGDIESIKYHTDQTAIKYQNNLQKVGGGNVLFYNIIPLAKYSKKELNYANGYMKEKEVFQLDEWANIEYNNLKDKQDSCAVKFLSSRFPKQYWNIKELETSNGVKYIDFIGLCEKELIPYEFYDINGKLIDSLKIKKSKDYQILRAIVYNTHVFPITCGKKLKRVAKKNYTIEIRENGIETLIEFIKEGILPSHIVLGHMRLKRDINIMENKDIKEKINIISFFVKKTKYIFNPEYKKCKKILEYCKCEDYLCDDISILKIPYILQKALWNGPKPVSFMPEKNLYSTLAFNYMRDINNFDGLVSEDKNKAFASALYDLEYILTFDFRTCNINKNPCKNNIIGTNLYWVTPEKSSLQLPYTGFYEGKDLIKFRDNDFKFELLEELECEYQPNQWRNIIDKMYKSMDQVDFKRAMVILIGNFEKNFDEKFVYKYKGIHNEEYTKMHSGFKYKIDCEYNLIYNSLREYDGVRDNFSLAVQIKNRARMVLLERIKERKISDKNIVSVATDCITYYGKKSSDLDPNNLHGWKEVNKTKEEYRNMFSLTFEKDNEIIDEKKDLRPSSPINTNNKPRILHSQYGGAGKTTYIINTLLPRLEKEGISYIVLTPSHKTLEEYKSLNINCQIIQYYENVDKGVPKEQYIIIDEIGFMDSHGHDTLFKINKANKSFECFGDFNQLGPIDGKIYNQPHYLNYMFNYIDTDYINYRNNFTVEYYDSLIDGKNIDYKKEVSDHSTEKYFNAELIISYRHKIREKYNKKMLRKLGKQPYGNGTKIIAINNKLSKIYPGIFNNKEFIIQGRNEDMNYILKDSNSDNIFIVNDKDIKYFEHSYCLNIHRVQGMTLSSYYWCKEDNNFLNGRVSYTIISRLYENKNEIQKFELFQKEYEIYLKKIEKEWKENYDK